MNIPVNVITGFLGSGKTSAIRHLLSQKPADERWAILFNEFGTVGIDAVMVDAEQPGVTVEDVAGGCICCANAMNLRVALPKLLRRARPDRLLIEPTGLGHPAGIVDLLRERNLANTLRVGSTLCMADARDYSAARFEQSEVYREQLETADIVVINKCDLSSETELIAFDQFLRTFYPPKSHIHRTVGARLQLEWLDEAVEQRATDSRPDGPARPAASPSPQECSLSVHHDKVRFYTHSSDGYHSLGWHFPAELVFNPLALTAFFEQLTHDAQVYRAKGVFHTGMLWHLFNVTGESVSHEISKWRSDSRFELIADRYDKSLQLDIERRLRSLLMEKPKMAAGR